MGWTEGVDSVIENLVCLSGISKISVDDRFHLPLNVLSQARDVT